ncbi:MAG: DUF3662 domain-containing protein [Propionibacteriaceae bacterium]|jgi:hypothetical protein|nr:DUF3662 domain-containing protein [Propionibacteriaceae bacterium]
MGFFDRLERRLEGVVNKMFTAFPGDVMPLEIANAMIKEMDTRAKALSSERRLAPNDYTVRLAQRDYERLAPYSRTLNGQIIPTLREHAAERGYVFNGTLAITYLLDETLRAGTFTLECQVVAGVVDNTVPAAADDDTPSGRIQRAPLVLEVNGVRHPLLPPGLTIGRGSEADLRISDPGISRMHARIEVSGDPGQLRLKIVDLGSANGITVNGEQVLETELGSGSRIEIGSTRMLVHAPIGE